MPLVDARRRVLPIPWKAGPLGAPGPLLVTVTELTLTDVRHLPMSYVNGMRLRALWPGMRGAVRRAKWWTSSTDGFDAATSRGRGGLPVPAVGRLDRH